MIAAPRRDLPEIPPGRHSQPQVFILGGPYPTDFVDTVRSNADIVRVVADYVPLKQAGRRMKGLCPFHQEKTPSFSVDPSNQLFYCFGCQTGGDIFKFVMLYDKVGFTEALEGLARRFGVPVPARSGKKPDGVRERLLEMNRVAEAWFRGMLTDPDAGAAAREYLVDRGLSDETAERLALGYAPDAWEALGSHLTAKRFPSSMLLQGGLVAARKSGQGNYDRFRHRLIFPIRDIEGRTVAFGGRALGDSPAKYINSPETPAYTKGHHLYGLHEARDKIRREGFAVVVEGYMDLAALVQAGFENGVASLGTAFTPAQARLLGRFTERVVFSYDGDSAGAAATTRSLDLLLERGFDVRVVDLPGGQDPDDFIRAEGAEAYDRRVRGAPGYLEFLLQRATAGRSIDRVEDKVAAANEMLPHLAKIDNAVERATWVGRLADELDLEEGAVMQELRGALRTRTTALRQRPRAARPLRQAGARLVHLLVESESERERWLDELDLSLLDGSDVRRIVATILERARRGEPVDYPSLLEAFESRPEDSETLTRIAFHDEPTEGPDVEDCLCTFEKERLQRQGLRAVKQLRGGPDRPAAIEDVEGIDEIDQQLLKIQELARQRDALS